MIRTKEAPCVYREVALLERTAQEQGDESRAVAIISFDDKPGIQALAATAPDPPPERRAVRASRATMNTSDWQRRACWPASIS